MTAAALRLAQTTTTGHGSGSGGQNRTKDAAAGRTQSRPTGVLPAGRAPEQGRRHCRPLRRRRHSALSRIYLVSAAARTWGRPGCRRSSLDTSEQQSTRPSERSDELGRRL